MAMAATRVLFSRTSREPSRWLRKGTLLSHGALWSHLSDRKFLRSAPATTIVKAHVCSPFREERPLACHFRQVPGLYHWMFPPPGSMKASNVVRFRQQ